MFAGSESTLLLDASMRAALGQQEDGSSVRLLGIRTTDPQIDPQSCPVQANAAVLASEAKGAALATEMAYMLLSFVLIKDRPAGLIFLIGELNMGHDFCDYISLALSTDAERELQGQQIFDVLAIQRSTE
jgi:hypothetical protein